MKQFGYDIDSATIDPDLILKDHNPFLSRDQVRDLLFYIDQAKIEYEHLAIEHMMISKYWDSDFINSAYPGSFEKEARYHKLATLLKLIEEEVLIAKRKIHLNYYSRKQHATDHRVLNQQYIEAMQSGSVELIQTELFKEG